MSRRTDRVADLLRTEISEVIRLEVDDPRVRLATASEVDVSPDLRHAVVRVSVLGVEDDQRDETLAGLRRAAGFIRGRLARRLRQMKRLPELTFELDRGAEYSETIERLLESFHDQDQSS